MNLWCVQAPHFTAGAIDRSGTFVKAAPIIKWTVGKTVVAVKDYIKRKKGWCIYLVSTF